MSNNEVSHAYNQILTLVNEIKFHKRNCEESDCGVSISTLRDIAEGLLFSAKPDEVDELRALIDSTKGLW